MNVVLFLVSQSITLLGSTVVQMAIVWYITVHTLSGGWIALCSVCSYLPQFVVSFWGGVWADFYSRKFLIITADLFAAAAAFAMMICISYMKDEIQIFYLLLFMSVLRSAAAGVQVPAVNAVIPQIAPKKQLMRFNGINMAVQSAVQLVAPLAAGMILTFVDLQTVLFLDILTAAIGTGILSMVSIQHKQTERKKITVWHDMKIGMKYIWNNIFIRKLVCLYGIFIFLCVPVGFLAGLFVSRMYQNSYEYITIVEIVGFGGMIAGGFCSGVWNNFCGKKKILTAGLIIFGVTAIFMGLVKNFYCYLIFMMIYGMALTVIQTTITTLLQETVVLRMQGRVFGLVSSVYACFIPLGMTVFGILADIISLKWIMIVSGIVLILTSLIDV